MADDEDEGGFGGLYEDGHWDWDDTSQSLVFISDLPPQAVEAITISLKAPTGTIEFRDDIDVLEQMRFRRRYQRKLKVGQADIITVQDVKDIALFTAPINIMSPALINLLHQSTSERFMRALILYCQYYLQISDEMANRMIELETKVRIPDSEILEREYSDNLSDLRLLVAKEYCTMLIGGADTRKYHHMGPQKKRKSLSDKDARLFETLLRMCVQIVWLALGRRSFNQIDQPPADFFSNINISELELNRMFKSEIFNAVEHNLKTGFLFKMTKEERAVLLGRCVRHDKKLNTCSPLANEVFCHRNIDYRTMGLGVIKYPQITSRLHFLNIAVAETEEKFHDAGVTLGILSMPRSMFDTMLRPIPTGGDSKSKSKASMSMSRTSGSGLRKSTTAAQKFYPDVVIPQRDYSDDYMPDDFPSVSAEIKPCSEQQRKRWLNRLMKILHPQPTQPTQRGA